MVRKIIFVIIIVASNISAFAQKVDEVTLTVSSDGVTKEDATKLALRSAIEQAFGVFVSANTLILNDELVKDEIATIASGNIKKYDEIASVTLPNGNISVTLQAVVSISKLTSYAQSKGSSAEFAGQTFAMNIKLMELNKVNEEIAIKNMFEYVETFFPNIFDYRLELGEPKIQGGDVIIPASVIITANQNAKMINEIIGNTLISLSMSDDEIKSFNQAGMKCYRVGRARGIVTNTVVKDVVKEIPQKNKKSIPKTEVVKEVQEIKESVVRDIILRNDFIAYFKFLDIIVNYEKYNFKIVDNLGGISKFDIKLSDWNLSSIKITKEDLVLPFIRPRNYKPSESSSIKCNLQSSEMINVDIVRLISHHRDAEIAIKGDVLKDGNSHRIASYNYTDRFFIKFPRENLTKYNNFEIMRND